MSRFLAPRLGPCDQVVGVRRRRRERLGERAQVDLAAGLERPNAEAVLLRAMLSTESYRPAVRWFQAHAPVGPTLHVRAFAREGETAGDTTTMAAEPGAVNGTRAVIPNEI